MEKMDFVPLDELWEKYPNKFFAIVLAAKRARFISKKAREEGKHLKEKPTMIALREILEGKVEYTFSSMRSEVTSDLHVEDEGSTGYNE